MTESNSQSQLPSTIPATAEPPRARTWPLWLVCLILLAGLVALGLWSWQQWQVQQSLQQSVSHLSELNGQLDKRLSQTDRQRSDRLQSLDSSLAEQRQQLANQQRQIDHNASQLLDAGNRTRTDWLLAEAEYLIRIANQRLMVEQDIRGALAALRSADDVLRETDDIGVFPVREQLARDMMLLRGVSDVDRTGLYLQLEAARELVTRITDQALIREQTPGWTGTAQPQDASPEQEPNAFARAWNRIKTTLGGVVSIRRLDEPAKPLLSPDQSAWARLNLQLMLEQAALAVLRGHEDLYQQALDKALVSLNTWYDSSDRRVNTLRESLTELKGRQINPDLPDISQSLRLLKARIAGRHVNNEAPLDSDDRSAPSQGAGSAGSGES